MPGPRVYIHEFIDILGHNRARYMYHMTANWGPIGRAERAQSCFGVWGVVGSTGQWPQVVNLWEYENWDALGANFETELTGAGLQDRSLEDWWAAAAEFRSGGRDRILVAPDWSPSIASLCEHRVQGGLVAAGYAHEVVTCRPGSAAEILERVHADGMAAYAASGLTLVGAFARAMAADDECILIWAFPTWAGWAASEAGDGGAAGRWRRAQFDLATQWERILLADAPLSPLRIGRQPNEGDREPTWENNI